MFGFGKIDGLKRVEYNRRIKDVLEQRIGIETDNAKNPRFPAVFAFADLIARGWWANRSAEDTALMIALGYYKGTAESRGDHAVEARRIARPIADFLMEMGSSGKISEERGRQFVIFYDDIFVQD